MEMDFDWKGVNGLAYMLGGRIELLEKLIELKGLTPEMIQIINDSGLSSDFFEDAEDGGFIEKPLSKMKLNFKYDEVNALSNALGSRIELLERLIESAGLSKDVIDAINESDYRKDFLMLYGFHIDSNESDPFEAVTYLADAVGMKPAHMNYKTGKFDYGSWEDAFFMPRPCMLKYDGTVDYYLDPNDYSKKEDGTASDVADDTYGGNAMMEWGRDGKQIWYKIVPDEDDNTSASIYFSEYKLDEGFHAWSFINNQGDLVDHFYTPIYNGTLDTNGKLRSISEKANTDLCQGKSVAQEITAAELNNPGEDKLWYTETFADITLINLLLVLISKSLNTQEVFGNGAIGRGSDASAMIGTGTMDDKGLFFGANDTVTGVKVFGIENFWGNQSRRFAGLISANLAVKYKMTYGTDDGSEAESYNITAEGYLAAKSFASPIGGWITKYMFTEDGGMFIDSFRGSAVTYYADYGNVPQGTNYAYRGGSCKDDRDDGAFYCQLSIRTSWSGSHLWYIGASPSCKPLAKSN